MVFGIIILLAVVVIIWCLNCLSEQLSALYKKLNEIYDNLLTRNLKKPFNILKFE